MKNIVDVQHITYGFKEYWLLTYDNGQKEHCWHYTTEIEQFQQSRDNRG